MTEWKEYTGEAEQLDEMRNSEHGFITDNGGGIRFIKYTNEDHMLEKPLMGARKYLICKPHPRRDMAKQQLYTGQPVWIRMNEDTYRVIAIRNFILIYQDQFKAVIVTNTPDWNIPGAEYRFTHFEDLDIDK